MNRRTLISSLMMVGTITVVGTALNANNALAQCPQYAVNIVSLMPSPFLGPVDFEVHWDNGQIYPHSYTADGWYLHPSQPFPAWVVGVYFPKVQLGTNFVLVNTKVNIRYPDMPPGMCIQVEVREISRGCYDITLTPTGGC